MKLAALLGVSAALATAVGATSSAGSALDSGLTGKVLRGPVTPVCRADKPCYAPYKGVLVFTSMQAGAAPAPARTQTELDGDYKIMLQPARYRVTTGGTSRFGGRVRPSTVAVPQTGMRRVNFVIDTGIR